MSGDAPSEGGGGASGGGAARPRRGKLAPEPAFAPGHEHAPECDALYAEWKRYHVAVIDVAGRFPRGQRLLAHRERERFERQLTAIGCSGEARRRVERDAEIAARGRPALQ